MYETQTMVVMRVQTHKTKKLRSGFVLTFNLKQYFKSTVLSLSYKKVVYPPYVQKLFMISFTVYFIKPDLLMKIYLN